MNKKEIIIQYNKKLELINKLNEFYPEKKVIIQFSIHSYPEDHDKIRKIQDHHGASYAKELLGKVRTELKKYGGVKPPREFVLIDRAAIGLGSVFMHLKAELNWHNKFQQLIKGFTKQNPR